MKPLTLNDYLERAGAVSAPADAVKGKSLSTSVLSQSVASPASTALRPDADAALKLILDCLDDMKAEETINIDLRGKSSIADYMIVTSGRANRHVGAIAENVVKVLHEHGVKGVHLEGMPNCDWVLIDAGDIIVHVFRPEVRTFYNLEKMWAPAHGAQQAG